MERHIVQEKAHKKTALIITPPESVWPAIQQIRAQHDQKASTVWMPHIKLLFPFVDEDLFKHSLSTIQSVLSTIPPFTISLDRADYLEHSKKAFTLVLKPAAKANSDLVRLQRALENAFPQCDDISARFGTFNPHLTIGQFQDRSAVEAVLKQLNATWRPVEFTIQQVHLVSRRDSGKFVVRHSLSLTGTAASLAAQDSFLAPKRKPKQKANFSKCRSAPIYRYVNDEWTEYEPTDAELTNSPQSISISKLRVVSYNILFDEHESEKIHTQLRVPQVLALLKAQRAHIIGLQEVTTEFMSHLLHEEWVQKHYFISEQSAGESIQPYGQLLLSVFPFRLSVQSFFPSIKRFLFGEFVLNNGAQRLVVPVIHLTSEHGSGNTSETRKRQMAALYETLGDEQDVLVLGDFNFGDDHQAEIRSDYVDCWRALHPHKEGYTFDPKQNTVAAITSRSGRRMRYDRVLVRSSASRWRPVDMRLVGTNSIDMQHHPDAAMRSLLLFPSDHFGVAADLELILPERIAWNHADPLAMFLESLGAIESDQRILQKTSLAHHLNDVLATGFPESAILLYPIGSALLRATGPAADVDILCVANLDRAMFFERLPRILRAAQINHRIVSDALIPIAKLQMFDLEIDLQFSNPIVSVVAKHPIDFETTQLPSLVSAECLAGINSVREGHFILRAVPNVQSFRLVLLFVKHWAKQRGIYSNRLGYLGGISWTLMVARVCQMNAASTSSLELVAKFFAYFASFDWTSAVVSLNPAAEGAFQREQRDLMAILLPIRPFRNTARNLTPSTRDVIVTELRAAAQIVCATPTPITTLPESWVCQQLLGNVRENFFKRFGFYAQLAISAPTLVEFHQWHGFVESRVVDAVMRLEAQHIHAFPFVGMTKLPGASGNIVQQRHNGCLWIGLGIARSQIDLSKNASAILSGDWISALEQQNRSAAGRKLITVRVLDVSTVCSMDLSAYEESRVTEEEEIELLELETSSKNSSFEEKNHEEEQQDGAAAEEQDHGSDSGADVAEASSSPSSAKGAQSKKEKKKAAAAKGGKTNSKKKVDSNADPNQLPKNYKMRTCVEAYNRVKWDKSCNTADFIIGYEDRFDGVQEVGFDAFDTGEIPFHRIRYLKRLGEIVYDREKRIDKLFHHHKEKNLM